MEGLESLYVLVVVKDLWGKKLDRGLLKDLC